MKKSLDGLELLQEKVEEIFNEPEDRSVEVTESEEHRNNNNKKMEKKINKTFVTLGKNSNNLTGKKLESLKDRK